jgi:hypothetical protein
MSRTYIDSKGRIKLEPTAIEFNTKEREQLITNEPFGMISYNLPYSIGKRNRWQLCEYFEENPAEFQARANSIS